MHKLRSQPHQTHSHPVYNTDAKGGYRKCKSNTEQFQEVSWETIWDNKCVRYNAGSQTIWICASLTLNVLSSDFTTFPSCQPKNKHNEKFPWTRPQMTTRTNKPDKTWFFFSSDFEKRWYIISILCIYISGTLTTLNEKRPPLQAVQNATENLELKGHICYNFPSSQMILSKVKSQQGCKGCNLSECMARLLQRLSTFKLFCVSISAQR